MNISILNHNEISWTVSLQEVDIENVSNLVSILTYGSNWSQSIRKKDRESLHLLNKIENREFLVKSIEHIKRLECIPCKNSYERMLCYLLAKILHLKCRKEVETTYERVFCMDLDSPLLQKIGYTREYAGVDEGYCDCACELIRKEWGKNVEIHDGYEDFYYDLPIGRVVGVWCS